MPLSAKNINVPAKFYTHYIGEKIESTSIRSVEASAETIALSKKASSIRPKFAERPKKPKTKGKRKPAS